MRREKLSPLFQKMEKLAFLSCDGSNADLWLVKVERTSSRGTRNEIRRREMQGAIKTGQNSRGWKENAEQLGFGRKKIQIYDGWGISPDGAVQPNRVEFWNHAQVVLPHPLVINLGVLFSCLWPSFVGMNKPTRSPMKNFSYYAKNKNKQLWIFEIYGVCRVHPPFVLFHW